MAAVGAARAIGFFFSGAHGVQTAFARATSSGENGRVAPSVARVAPPRDLAVDAVESALEPHADDPAPWAAPSTLHQPKQSVQGLAEADLVTILWKSPSPLMHHGSGSSGPNGAARLAGLSAMRSGPPHSLR